MSLAIETASSPFIDQDAARELLGGISRGALAQMRYEGRGPAFYKVGRKILYRADDVVEFIESTRRTSTANTH
jgi:hypothetical protein